MPAEQSSAASAAAGSAPDIVSPPAPMRHNRELAPLSLVLVYAMCSALWILFSDRALAAWFSDPGQLALASALKGWAFVAVTAVLLYTMLRRRAPAAAASDPALVSPARLRGIAVRVCLAVALCAVLTAAIIAYSLDRHKSDELLRLRAVAEMKVQQLSDWLRERQADARLVQIGADTDRGLAAWRGSAQVQAQAQALAALVARIEGLRMHTQFEGASLLDENGDLIWRSPQLTSWKLPPALSGAREQIARQHLVQRLGPYLDEAGQPSMDFAVPLLSAELPAGRPVPLLLLHLGSQRYLPGSLRDWPVPSSTGEVVLARRQGDEVQSLIDLRDSPNAAMRLRLEQERQALLTARLIDPSKTELSVLDGVNYDGQRAFGVGGPVPGTDWFLLAKMNQDEIYAAAIYEALWILLAGALAAFVAGASLYLLRQRQLLALAHHTAQAQRERLRATALLGTIADSSEDAIFAKDLQGRYTLFNRAASRFVGRPVESVIGQDDRALFPPEQAEMLMEAGRRALDNKAPITQEEVLDTADGQRIFLATKGPLYDADGMPTGTFGMSRDITVLKQAEWALRQANRALLTSRECGQAVLRATDEAMLLHEVCQILVDTGGYRMAWVGLAQDDADRRVRPVAQAGFEDGHLDAVPLSWADDENGRGPTGRAIRERRTLVSRDILQDPTLKPWRESASQRGYASSIALPLVVGDDEPCFGALSIYASQPLAFDPEEVQLVEELASDISLGLRMLRERTARRKAEESLREQKDRLAESQRIAHVGNWLFDLRSRRITGSPEAQRLLGLEPQAGELSLKEALAGVATEGLLAARDWLAALLDGQDEDLTCPVQVPDGTQRLLSARGRLEHDASGTPLCLIGTVQDVTEAHQAESMLRRLAQRAEALLRLPALAEDGDESHFLQSVQEIAEDLTGSRFAFVHFIGTDGNSIERVSWSRRALAAFCGAASESHKPVDQAGVWADALRQRQPVVFNDYPGYAHKHGLPDGHIPLKRLVSVPVIEGGRVVMVSGVAGKAEDYTALDIETLQLISNDTWRLVQRRRSDAALLRSEQNYRALTEQVPAIIYRTQLDDASTTSYISQGVQSLGWTPAEWLADPMIWLDNLHPEDRDRVLAGLLAAKSDGIGIDLHYRLRSRCGQWRHFHDKAQVMLDAGGQPQALQGLMLDETQRLQDETELRKLYQAVEQSPNAIVVTNLQAEIEYVNQAFLDSTGYSREEVIGRNPKILHPDDYQPGAYAALWAALSEGRPWKGEFRNRRKDGSIYIELAHLAPLRQSDGRITHYVGVKEDITEKTRISEELARHRQHLEELVQERTAELASARLRAEAANRAKSAFLANMSHEIRTPMNAIIGLSHLLQRDGLTPQQTSRLARIDGAAMHLLSLINGVLDLSKIEAGKLVLEQADFSLPALLDGVQALINDRAAAKGVQVHVDCGGVTSWLHGDATRLRQALLNYADNALKFTAQGRIDLRASLQADTGPDLLLRLEVQDTGIGIDATELPRLFQVFEQADASTTRRFGGTGLGLALTQRLAALMGGETGVHSQPGVGSRFWFTARVRPGQSAPRAGPAAVTHDALDDPRQRLLQHHKGARVLLAEDDPTNREVAQELLQRAGMHVTMVEDGQQAVQAAHEQNFDLVLMDVQMPVLDGFGATAALRNPGSGVPATLPILALTANAFDQDRQACLAAGMNDFVSKPVEPRLLYEALLRWLSSRQVQTPQVTTRAGGPAADGVADEADSLHTALSRVDDLDPTLGLQRVGGDLGMYLRLLRALHLSHRDDGRILVDHLEAGRLHEARDRAHQLKGAAGALGAVVLQDRAAALEQGLRDGGSAAELQAQASALLDCSDRLFDQLAWVLLPAPTHVRAAATESTPPAPEQVRQVLSALQASLAADDANTLDLFDRYRPLLQDALGPLATTLARQIEAFEFPAALRSLKSAQSKAQTDAQS